MNAYLIGLGHAPIEVVGDKGVLNNGTAVSLFKDCLLYTSDAADDLLCVDLGGRRIIKKKKKNTAQIYSATQHIQYNEHHRFT